MDPPRTPSFTYSASVDRQCPYGFKAQVGYPGQCRNCYRSKKDHDLESKVVQMYDSLKRGGASSVRKNQLESEARARNRKARMEEQRAT